MTDTTLETDDSSPFVFDNTFAREMEGFWVQARPAHASAPRMVAFNGALAEELGLEAEWLDSERGARLFAGAELPAGAEPLAQVYAGHQFGGFSRRLGDGRALLLGEVIDRAGARRDIQLKGSGPTTFSRGGDGLAGLGPVLREYLISEGMHALGVPTTRALAAVTTGETVYREEPIPGAVLTRVAASHVRVGTFQYFASQGDQERVRQLADYVLARHDPELPELLGQEGKYLGLLEAVCERQAYLIARWMQVGFIHGVMNTDNVTISGETIDYGPCAFLDRYAPDTVFSSIDRNGRYAYGRQPQMAFWNLSRFAEALLPILDADADRAVVLATAAVESFVPRYEAHWLNGMRAKLGLGTERDGDEQIVGDFLSALHDGQVDFTLAFRSLAQAVLGDRKPLRSLFACAENIDAWLERWEERLELESVQATARAKTMQRANPAFIPRNHKVEEALEAAVERSDLGPFQELLEVIRRPFDEQPGREAYSVPAALDAEPYQTFCGT
ncbi:MAG: hypothetical protein ACI8QZ_004385 [Chlamydiales bacterium]|jgi:uncharacterized protein YdiU (UPF0061 family)